LRFNGTSWSRNASVGACSETARATGQSCRSLSIIVVIPEVETVTRRRDSP
jgi:hypothetical protein